MIDPAKGQQHVDGFLGATKTEVSPEQRAAAVKVTRRWCAAAGLDEAATVDLLDMLGLLP